MAKAWYDNQVPTMEMGLLSGMPDMSLTAEDKKRALLQALMQGGLGMAAASLGGANTSQAMGRGLLGGADAYGQGLQAPMGRFEMAKKQLEFQGNQLNNAKLLNEYKQGQQQADIFKGAAQNATNGAFDQLGQINNAYLQNGPQQQQLDNVGGFNRAYAQSLSQNLQSPDTIARFGAAGGDIGKLTGYMNAVKPQTIPGGSWQQDQFGQMTFVPKIADNATLVNGKMVPIDGAADTLAKLAAAPEWGKLNPMKAFEAFKMNNAVQVEPTTGLPFRVGETTPVIGNPDPSAPQGAGAKLPPRQVAMTPAQTAAQNNLAKGNDLWREQTLIPILKAESAARANNDQLKALDNIDLKTGFGTESLAALSSPFAALGYTPAEKYTKSVESFRAIVNDQQLVKQMQQAGVQTEGDAKRSMATLAALGNTPAANEFIKDFARATNNAVLAKAQFYSAAHNHALERGETNLTKLDSTWRKSNYSIWDDPVMARWKKQ